MTASTPNIAMFKKAIILKLWAYVQHGSVVVKLLAWIRFTLSQILCHHLALISLLWHRSATILLQEGSQHLMKLFKEWFCTCLIIIKNFTKTLLFRISGLGAWLNLVRSEQSRNVGMLYQFYIETANTKEGKIRIYTIILQTLESVIHWFNHAIHKIIDSDTWFYHIFLLYRMNHKFTFSFLVGPFKIVSLFHSKCFLIFNVVSPWD